MSVVLDAIYACASDPNRWEDLIDVYTSLEPHLDDTAASLSDGGAMAETLLPHLDRAEDVARRVLQASAPAVSGGLAGGQTQAAPLPVVYVLIGRDQRIISTSPSVPDLLASFCEPLGQGKIFAMEDPENQKRYRGARDALKNGDGIMPVLFNFEDGTAMQSVSGFLVDAAHAGRLLATAEAIPLHADAHALILPDRTALVRHDHLLRASLGLTPAELRLANLLKDGLSLADAAPQLGIAVNTARNQLRGIFTKLGVNRQSEMVRHLAELGQLAAFVRSGDPVASASVKPVISGSGLSGKRDHVALPDGRLLAYRDYGRRGDTPVIFLHAVLSNSNLRESEISAAMGLGLRLIVPERPGTGRSTPDPAMSFESVGRDIAHLADVLKLEEVYVTGRSSGAPFALEVARCLGARVPRLMLWSARFTSDLETNRVDVLGRFYAGMRRMPWYAEAALALIRAKLARGIVKEILLRSFERSPVDHKLMANDPALLEFMATQTLEALELTHAGVAQEAALLQSPEPVNLDGLIAPLVVWHGAADGFVSAKDVERRFSNLPVEELRIIEGEGHVFSLEHRIAVLERLTSARTA